MPDSLQCFRCGTALDALTLPLSRQDQCPNCARYLHVCRMCESYDPHVARQCREDDAEEVMDKEKPNFCDWFKPAAGRFDHSNASVASQAQQQLESLFGEAEPGATDESDAHSAAEDLFR